MFLKKIAHFAPFLHRCHVWQKKLRIAGILYSCCRTLRLRRGGDYLLALHEELHLPPHLDELQRLDELRDLVAAVVDPLDAVATSATGSSPVFFLPLYHYLKFRCTGP